MLLNLRVILVFMCLLWSCAGKFFLALVNLCSAKAGRRQPGKIQLIKITQKAAE